MSDKPEVAKPFSNGREYFNYRENNCDECAHGYDEDKGYHCRYEKALDRAYANDGFVRADYLEVIGLGKERTGKCPKFKTCDGSFRFGTVEYENQRKLDEAMLAAWTKGA
jgi:hypothetical protein